MGPLIIGMLGFGGLIVIIGLVLMVTYNGLVASRNQNRNAWSQIDVQLKRRHDLIPNLIETVRGYAGHEKQTLEAVIQARNQAIGAGSVDDRIKAEAGLGAALGKLMVLSEAYPELKANTNFLALQEELSSTENKIGFSRQFYNDSTMSYNTKLESFPTNIIGGMFQFKPAAFFQVANEAEREAPKVKF